MAPERQVRGVRSADLPAAMGPHDPADGGQRFGLEGGDAPACAEQRRATTRSDVFPRWPLARVYLERIRALGGIRAAVSGARHRVAGLLLRRLGSNVVAASQRTVLLVTRFAPDGRVVHRR